MVKRFFTLFIVFAVSMLSSITAYAATTYDLTIKGVKVTSDNASDILGDGHVKYDAATKTLTISETTIEGGKNVCISSKLPDLNIVLHNAKFKSTNQNAFSLNGNVTIKSVGSSIEHSSSGNSAIYFTSEGGTLTFKSGSFLSIISSVAQFAIRSYYPNTKLILEDCHLYLKTIDNQVPLSGFGDVEFKGASKFIHKGGATYNTTSKRVVNSTGNTVLGLLLIDTYFGFTLDGYEAAYYTASNDKIVTGIFKDPASTYSPTTNTLYLKNYKGGGELLCGRSDFTVNIEGENDIDYLVVSKDVKFTGTGVLNVKNTSEKAAAVCIQKSKLYAENSRINVNGRISDDTAENLSEIELNKTMLVVDGNGTNPTIEHLKSGIICNDVAVVEPFSCKFNSEQHNYCTSGTNAAKSKIVLAKDYDMSIGVKKVSSYNASDIRGDKRCSYDYETNTLSMQNVAGVAVKINEGAKDNMTIKMTGNNSFYGVTIAKNVTIAGDGVGMISNYDKDSAYDLRFMGDCKKVTVKNANIDMMKFISSSDTELVLDNSNVTLTPLSGNPMSGFKSVKLQNNDIYVKPYNVAYNETSKRTEVDGKEYLGTLMIQSAEDLGVLVADTKVTTANCSDVLGDKKVSYNKASGKLTLNNAVINAENAAIVAGNAKIIEFIGAENTLTSTKGNGIVAEKDLTICSNNGQGVLTVNVNANTSSATPILATGENLTIKDCTIKTNHTIYGNGIKGALGTTHVAMTNVNIENKGTGVATFADVICENVTMKVTGTGFSNTIPYTFTVRKALNINSGSTSIFVNKGGDSTKPVKIVSPDFAKIDLYCGAPGYSQIQSYNDVEIENCNITTNGNTHGVVLKGDNGALTINSSRLESTTTATGNPPMKGVAKLVFDNYCGITTPGATFNAEQMTIYKDGKSAMSFTIEPLIKVGDVYVTAYNDINFLDGRGSFDMDTKTLKLKRLAVDTEGPAFVNNMEGVTLVLDGANYLYSSNDCAMLINKSLTIKGGEDEASISATSETGAGISHTGGTLKYRSGCTVNAEGKTYGIQGNKGSMMFDVDDCSISAKGNTAAVYGYTKQNVVDSNTCYIKTPADATFNLSLTGIAVGNSLCKEVAIVRGQKIVDGILDASLDAADDNAPAYNLQGVRVGNNYRGMVIKGGKKYMVK